MHSISETNFYCVFKMAIPLEKLLTITLFSFFVETRAYVALPIADGS